MDLDNLVRSFRQEVRRAIGKEKLPNPIIHPNIQFALSHVQGASHIYRLILNARSSIEKQSERCWNRIMPGINWPEVYTALEGITKSTYYKALHYKIATRICVTNLFLHRINVKDTPVCNRCNRHVDTIEHKYFSCIHVRIFWRIIAIFFRTANITVDLSQRAIPTNWINRFKNNKTRNHTRKINDSECPDNKPCGIQSKIEM